MTVLTMAWICSIFWAYAAFSGCNDTYVTVSWESCVNRQEQVNACVAVITTSYGFPWASHNAIAWAYPNDPYATFDSLSEYGFSFGEIKVMPESVPYVDIYRKVIPSCTEYQSHALWVWALCTVIALASSFYELLYVERLYNAQEYMT